jgi:predicted ATP-binding protein involved in virulence
MAQKEVEIENQNHSYFHSLELEGINCFKDKQILDLSDGDGDYSQWTIILGDNGTGKTTLLRVLDRMQPVENQFSNKHSDILVSNPAYAIEFKLKNNGFYSSHVKLFIKNNKEKAYLAINKKEDSFQMTGHRDINSYLLSYGASRRMSKNPNVSKIEENLNKTTSLFDESIDLINAEEWYLQKFLAYTTSEKSIKNKLENQLILIKKMLIDFLPDVLDVGITQIKNVNDKSSLEVKISEKEWINLRDLSFGYQTLTALIVDIASKMMEQYPNSNKPLEEPVIVLIDEIDLHLHPKWQRTVIDKLSENFPKAQFIATSHSPLIVQAAQDRNANIVVCRKEGDKVIIDNNPDEVKGWRIDQILISDLFDTGSSQSKEIEEIRTEKINILLKNDLTPTDKKRLDFINEKLNSYPIFSSKDAINAEELIKKAAELLKK